MKIKKAALMVAFAAMLFTVPGCGDKKANISNETGNLKKVKVILDYVPNTNHTGIYVAKDLGYYKEQGLEVEIIEPTEGNTESLIATEKGDFGISYQENVTNALVAEDPLPIKAIAAIIQHNTSGFASYAKKNIKSIKDFEGKTYAGWGSPIEEAIIKGLMTSEGADFKKIKMITSDGVDYTSLKDKIDLIWMFEAWDGVSAKMAGVDINYLELRKLDNRLDYYTPVIIANKNKIEKDPETVKKFMAATSKGYNYAIDNPDKAAEILHKTADTYDIEMLKESQRLLAGKYSEGAQVWGQMKDKVWDDFTGYLLEKKLIKKSIPASECYTNEFLPK